MKKNHLRITSVLVLLLLTLSLLLASCEVRLAGLPEDGGTTAGGETDNAAGGTGAPDVDVDTETDGDTGTGTESGGASGDNTVNNVVIETDRASTAYAAACGLRSAVSVYCSFETTTSGGSFWNPTPTTKTYYSTGSGVIYRADADGNAYLITNFHVVYDETSNSENGVSEQINVYLYGRESERYAIPAVYLGGSAYYDIAVLRVTESDVLASAIAEGSVAAVQMGNSDALVPGDTAIAIGNPSSSAGDLGGLSVTVGVVSVESEHITMSASDGSGDVSMRVIRTDAPVNAGNSGGGLYNEKGELIGIVNAKIVVSSIESIGYAIPASVARGVADNIIDYCDGTDCESVMRAILGVTVQSNGLSTVYDPATGLLSRREEVCVYAVTEGSLAEGVFLCDDVVLSVTVGDNETVTVHRQHHLIDAMLDARAGDTVTFRVLREGVETTLTATVTEDCLTAS